MQKIIDEGQDDANKVGAALLSCRMHLKVVSALALDGMLKATVYLHALIVQQKVCLHALDVQQKVCLHALYVQQRSG